MNETGQKIRCNPNTDNAQLIVKTGDRSTACVCLYRSLKLLKDDRSDFVPV